jgi:antitoxin ParD1/3/4
MRLEVEQEEDGRWLAEAPDLPGASAYGVSRSEAIAKVEALALRVMADRLEHGERTPDLDGLFSAAMSTMNLSLPESLKAFVNDRVADGGYGASSEYVRELIRKDQDRQHLRRLVLEGVASPSTAPVDDAYFSDLRAGVRKTG